MKDTEKYAKELAGIPFSELAMTKDGKICRCEEILCRDCAFYERKFTFCREAERVEAAEHRAEVAEKDLERHKRALRNAVWGLITEGVYGGDAETEQGLQSEIQNEIERAEREIEEEKGE